MWKIAGHADAGLFATEGAAIAKAWQLADSEGALERATVHEVHDDLLGQLTRQQAGSGPATQVPAAPDEVIEVEVWASWKSDLMRGLLSYPPVGVTVEEDPARWGIAASRMMDNAAFADATAGAVIAAAIWDQLHSRLREVAHERKLTLGADAPTLTRYELPDGQTQLFRMATTAESIVSD
jgi:hypothetical protein